MSQSPEVISIGFVPSSLGLLLVARSAKGICAIFMGENRETLRTELLRRFPDVTLEETLPAAVGKAVRRAVENPASACDLPLDLRGTEFQRRVWRALCRLPAGKTTTYTALAQSMGARHAVRAVGTACGANHIAVLVPCHRVIRRDGALAGYRWGLARKQKLLAREGVAAVL